MVLALQETGKNRTKTAAETFHCHLASVTYAGIPPLRNDIEKFLAHRSVAPSYAGMVLLSVTEILTNLVKHPSKKADFIEISITLGDGTIVIDVADNASPFADFDAKCNTAFSRADAAMGLAESGYGIGCMLQQHAEVCYTPFTKSADRLNHFIIRDAIHFPGESHGKTPLRRKTVFLVDDDPVALGIHQRMLENTYNVVAFDDARKLLDVFHAQNPDIIISDLSMPGMDGIALRRALSGIAGGDTTPFVFLSGHRAGAHNAYINRLGVDDYLFKPVTKERLLAVTARLLNRSAQFASALQGRFHHDLTNILSPSLPDACLGWKIRTLSYTAEAGGGDFTLHHETSIHMLGVIADVMGHGQQAKFFAYAYSGYLRSIFRTMAATADAAYFLEKLSRMVDGDDFLENTFMTCQAFQLLASGEFRVASAGHPPPVIIGKNDVIPLDVAGPLPGLVGESRYEQKKLKLARGEKVLIATDGFFQAYDSPPDLVSVIAGMGSCTLDDIAGMLWLEFQSRRETSTSAQDDATLIIAEYGGTA